MMRYVLALMVSLLLVPSLAEAQGPVQIFVGDRVRVTAPECQLEKQPATLVSIENDLLSATVGETGIQCPVQALTRLEVSLGEREWWTDSVKGMKIGALAGLAAAVALFAGNDPEDEAPTANAFLALAGASGAGFLIGTAVGAIRDPEDWAEVSLPRPSVPFSRGNRLHLGFSIPLRD